METQRIRSPGAELNIVDVGPVRRIFVNGTAMVGGRRIAVAEAVETPYATETIRKFVELKGDWWLDEIKRRSDPDYVRRRFETLVRRFGPLKGARVLDAGSGSGSSALMMLDAGAAHVTGVEIIKGFVELARMRARDEDLLDKTAFIHVADTTRLPFANGSFDLVTFNAVLEHVPPALRAPILREAWRCLAPGGLLVVTETPNRAFPYDDHTTRLPLLPWLPLPLAYQLAKLLSRGVARGKSKDEYVSEGLVGGSYWQIRRALPDAVCLNAKGGDARWKSGLKNAGLPVRSVLRLAEIIANAFGLPLNAFMPVLDLVFRKTGRAH